MTTEREGALSDAAMDRLLDRGESALRADAARREGDDDVIAAIVAKTLAAATTPAPKKRAALARLPRRTMLLAAAAMLVTCIASAAIYRFVRAPAPAPTSTPPPTVAPLAAAPSPPLAAALEEAPAAAVTSLPEAPRVPSAPEHATPPPAETPASLFREANDARRRSDPTTPDLYRRLQRQFPASPEARLSRIALGRLYLNRLGSPSKALAEFDAYLAGGPGELEEEALVGRALALGRLGQAASEKTAWQTLLSRYPSSLSADRARARLDDLP